MENILLASDGLHLTRIGKNLIKDDFKLDQKGEEDASSVVKRQMKVYVQKEE